MTFRLDQQSTVTVLASLLTAGLCLLAACGGRSRTVLEEGDDTTPSAGAPTVGHAGAPSVGHAGAPSVGHAGAPGAGASAVAGASSSAGGAANQCDNVNCALPSCPAGSKLGSVAGSCCPVCVPICAPAQGCPALGCGPGTHSESLPGVCCPVCVDDPGVTCAEGMKGYAQQRAQLLQKYQFGCASDAECVVLAPSNLCENGCQYAAVWSGAANFFTDNLANYADMNCASCTTGPIPPCAAPLPPRCLMGQCMFAAFN